jgi:DNA (cytosine-5)-methyltransferase 1
MAHAKSTRGCGLDESPEGGNGRREGKARSGGEDALQHADSGGPITGWRSQQSRPGEARWGMAIWLVEPDVGRVAHGVPNLVGSLRAYGNAIVPQVAAAFVSAYMDVSAIVRTVGD